MPPSLELTHRDFLTRSAAALGAALGGSSALAAAPPAAIGLGFSLYGMKSLPPAAALKACAEIGYDNVELALMPGWPTEPRLLSPTDRKQLAATLGQLGLKLSALMENVSPLGSATEHQRTLDRLAAAAELGHDLAPAAHPVIETVLGGSPAQWESVLQTMADRLRSWGDLAAKHQTRIAIKPHVGGALHTPDAALWLLKEVNHPWIKLAYDFSHYELRGYDLATTIKALAPHSAFIHVKDSEGSAAKFKFLLPGEGRIDYAKYAALLKEVSYRGPVVVEVSGLIFNQKGYDPIAAAKKSHAALAPHFRS